MPACLWPLQYATKYVNKNGHLPEGLRLCFCVYVYERVVHEYVASCIRLSLFYVLFLGVIEITLLNGVWKMWKVAHSMETAKAREISSNNLVSVQKCPIKIMQMQKFLPSLSIICWKLCDFFCFLNSFNKFLILKLNIYFNFLKCWSLCFYFI